MKKVEETPLFLMGVRGGRFLKLKIDLVTEMP